MGVFLFLKLFFKTMTGKEKREMTYGRNDLKPMFAKVPERVKTSVFLLSVCKALNRLAKMDRGNKVKEQMRRVCAEACSDLFHVAEAFSPNEICVYAVFVYEI